jgi:multicomponent Na+:H+ antiporter subunit D
MIGLPPAAGFASKWLIVSGALQAHDWLALGVLTASTLLNAGYFLPIVYRAFFGSPPADAAPHGEAPASMVAALVVTAALTVLMFFFADLPLALAQEMLR